MSYLHSTSGLTLRDKVRSSDNWKELIVDMPPSFHYIRTQLRLFRHLIRMPPDSLPVGKIWAYPTGRRPWGRPRASRMWTIYIGNLGWESLGIPQVDLEDVALRKIQYLVYLAWPPATATQTQMSVGRT